MAVRICLGIPFPLSSTMKYYGSQSEIRVKTFAHRNLPESSLLNYECLNRFSKVMVVRIYVGIPYQLLSAMIYYGP